MAPKTVVFYYCRSILLCILICCDFSPRKTAFSDPFAVVNRYGHSDLLRRDLLPVGFLVWLGPLGKNFRRRAEYCFESTVSEEENSLSLAEFWGKLGEFWEKLGEFALAHT